MQNLVKRLALPILLVTSITAHAADPVSDQSNRKTLYYDSPPTAQELGEFLFPNSTSALQKKSITINDKADPRPEPEPELRAVGMPILFDYGEISIVVDSKPFLDSVGEMLASDQYSDRTLVVEGHTDSVGSRQFNQRLSELRALAVRNYLVDSFDIEHHRLLPIGLGEQQLLRPDKPKDGENRRVEFVPYSTGG